MAITQRTGPHDSWLVVGGQSFQCLEGTATLSSTNDVSSIIDVRLPLNAPGYAEFFAGVGEVECQAVVMTADGTAMLARGKIRKVEFNLIGGVIHVNAKDEMVELNNSKSFESFSNQRHSPDIIGQWLGKLGIPFTGDQSPTMAGKKVQQDYVKITDGPSLFSAISQFARFDGARFWIDKSGTFNYKIGDTGGGSASLFWQKPAPGSPMVSDCLSLEVVHNVYIAGMGNADTNSFLPPVKTTNSQGNPMSMEFAGQKKYNDDVPNEQPSEAMQRALARADAGAEHEWEVHATVVGDPSITQDMSVTLSGSGLFDQTYKIDKVTHRFGYNGFTTTINSKSKGKSSS